MRRFLSNIRPAIVALFACAIGSASVASQQQEPADLIVLNAKILTLSDALPEAQALAVRGEKFVAVGREDEVMGLRGDRTRVIDAGGRRVIPGLNDSHIHAVRGGRFYNLELRWDGVESLEHGLADDPRSGEADAEGPVGARHRWLVAVPVQGTAHADGRRAERGSPGHASLRPLPLQPGDDEQGWRRGIAAHAAERATRGRALRVRRRGRRHSACRSQSSHPLHHHRKAPAAVCRGPDQLDEALLPRAQPFRPHQCRRPWGRRARVSDRLPGEQRPGAPTGFPAPHLELPVRPEGGDRVAGLREMDC